MKWVYVRNPLRLNQFAYRADSAMMNNDIRGSGDAHITCAAAQVQAAAQSQAMESTNADGIHHWRPGADVPSNQNAHIDPLFSSSIE